MKWIKRLLGITELIKTQKKTNELLDEIRKQVTRGSDLQASYNKSYYIK